jgi:anaerobic magnesium-protoporphyrin IX monomethyl ester cyclase
MSRVLLGHSYFLRFDPKLWSARQPYAPLGTLYAAACLRADGHDVAVFDAMLASSEAEWRAAVERQRPRVAVLFEDSFNYLSKMCLLRMRAAAVRMLADARASGAVTIAAGSDATDHPDVYLDAGADYVILGEGEETLRELARALDEARAPDVERVAGLAYRAADGTTRRTAGRPIIRDLDRLPFPAWDLVDVERYRAMWTRRHGYFSMNLVTTRGCPYHCNWCAKPIYGQRYTVRSPAHVAEEMAWLVREYAPDHFLFADDILGLQPGWIERFADEVAARGGVRPFKCLLRADLVRETTAPALARAGCRTVWMGAESGSQRVLDAMEKGIRVEQIREAAARLRRAGIEVGFFLQFGYPGETRDDIEQTLRLVRECRPDDIGISVSYPMPGTTFYDRVEAELGAKRNWVDSNDLAMMYAGPFPTPFYRALHGRVHAEFRLRKAWRAVSARAGLSPAVRLRRAGSVAYHAAALPIARARVAWQARRRHAGIVPIAPALSPADAARPSRQE